MTDEFFSYSVRGELTDFYELTPHYSTSYYHTSTAYWASGALETLSIPNVPTLYYGASNNSGAGLDGEKGAIRKSRPSSGTNPVTGVTYSTSSSSNSSWSFDGCHIRVLG